MKKLLLLLMGGILLVPCQPVLSQTTKKEQKEIAKTREYVSKQSKKQLEAKASKDARKEAKRFKKEGWEVTPGTLPLDKQLDKSYLMQYEYDENMAPKYLMAEAMSTGGNYDAAKTQALELSKQNLAGQIQTEITAIVENTVSNEQLSQGEAESITRTVNASKNLIVQSIGRVVPVIECYRTTANGNKEVMVRIAYNTETAMKAANDVVRKQLEDRGEQLHGQLDKVFGF